VRPPGSKHVAVPHAPGVYLFTENVNHRYIGRSKNLNARLGKHTQPKQGHNSAPFAFNITELHAREAGFEVAGRTSDNLGSDRELREKFFSPAKLQSAMDFRFVIFDAKEADVHAFSTVFEVYAAMVHGPNGDFNLFRTH
jgi:hypothetical protein